METTEMTQEEQEYQKRWARDKKVMSVGTAVAAICALGFVLTLLMTPPSSDAQVNEKPTEPSFKELALTDLKLAQGSLQQGKFQVWVDLTDHEKMWGFHTGIRSVELEIQGRPFHGDVYGSGTQSPIAGSEDSRTLLYFELLDEPLAAWAQRCTDVTEVTLGANPSLSKEYEDSLLSRNFLVNGSEVTVADDGAKLTFQDVTGALALEVKAETTTGTSDENWILHWDCRETPCKTRFARLRR